MAQSKKIITLVAGVMAVALFLSSCTDEQGDRYIGFAQCVTKAGATMYGAYWCPHCAQQKADLGMNAFKNINYVECDLRGENQQAILCAKKKIASYPTWEFADGTRMTGEKPLTELANKTKCALPAAGDAATSK